jgi:hypothetical protein
MVLGFILYESFDLVYHVGKFTVNGVFGIYNWYYDINNYKPIQGMDRYELLEDKIDNLTKQIELINMSKS